MISLRSTGNFALLGAGFADPDWRGDHDCDDEPANDVRPLSALTAQAHRLEDWIRGGSCYGWLDAYQARRAAFELQSIRVQQRRDSHDPGSRRAIQSRLDRLDEVISEARRAGQR